MDYKSAASVSRARIGKRDVLVARTNVTKPEQKQERQRKWITQNMNRATLLSAKRAQLLSRTLKASSDGCERTYAASCHTDSARASMQALADWHTAKLELAGKLGGLSTDDIGGRPSTGPE
ncbi:hypothetical protein [Paraburkholderia heleia]|uniref:hypothetical protein n=1 Tax=Paraburkholderia heleia TaxID=634127 RepID=UPI002AB6008A|nr:hypothetical protein [Paraburkholderia heleia]